MEAAVPTGELEGLKQVGMERVTRLPLATPPDQQHQRSLHLRSQ